MEEKDYCMNVAIWPGSQEINVLLALIAIIMLAYCSLLSLSCYNFYQFLLKEGRYRIMLLTSFYFIVISLSLVRLASLSQWFRFYDLKSDCKIYFA